jgi:ubiquinone biosynthesis protein UbiJ
MPPQETQNVIAAAIVTLAVAIQGVLAHRSSTRTRKSVSESLTELRGICIGADGKNGLRGDIAEVKRSVERLEKDAWTTRETVARLDERTKNMGKES